MTVVRRGDLVTERKHYQPQRLSGKPEGGPSIAAIRELTKIALCNHLLLPSEYDKLVILVI